MNKDRSKEIRKFLESIKKLDSSTLNISKDTKKEYNAYEKYLEKTLKKETLKQDIEDRKSNRELKEKYAEKMFQYMCIWSVFIVIVIILSGLGGLWKFSFQLDKWVLITLIGSTTVSIFAIVRAIIEGIFKG